MLSKPLTVQPISSETRICYAFLAVDQINNEKSWYNYFNQCSDSFEILIHIASSNKSKYLTELTNNTYVNEVPTQWSRLLTVELFLLEKTRELGCSKIIYLSHSCLPIKTLDYVHRYLENNYSYLAWELPTEGQWYRTPAKHSFTRAQHQWCILDKQHFDLFLEHPLRKYFEQQVTFPEEFYFASILNEQGLLTSDEVGCELTTFVDWSPGRNTGGSPYYFSGYSDYDYELIKKVKDVPHHLFIRKMGDDLDGRLLNLITTE